MGPPRMVRGGFTPWVGGWRGRAERGVPWGPPLCCCGVQVPGGRVGMGRWDGDGDGMRLEAGRGIELGTGTLRRDTETGTGLGTGPVPLVPGEDRDTGADSGTARPDVRGCGGRSGGGTRGARGAELDGHPRRVKGGGRRGVWGAGGGAGGSARSCCARRPREILSCKSPRRAQPFVRRSPRRYIYGVRRPGAGWGGGWRGRAGGRRAGGGGNGWAPSRALLHVRHGLLLPQLLRFLRGRHGSVRLRVQSLQPGRLLPVQPHAGGVRSRTRLPPPRLRQLRPGRPARPPALALLGR